MNISGIFGVVLQKCDKSFLDGEVFLFFIPYPIPFFSYNFASGKNENYEKT